MTKQKKPDKSSPNETAPRERDPVTDIRLPLIILFLWTAMAGYATDVPAWVALPAGAIFAFSWALFRERALLVALMSNWRTPWLIAGPIAGVFLYFLLEMTIQTVSGAVMDSGAFAPGKELPALFRWLLALRASAGDIPPVVLGLGGGLLLGVGEELFWRGFIQTRFMLFTGHGVSVLLTALLYALMYLFAFGPLPAVLSLFLGIVLSMFTLRSRSLLPAMSCHSTFLIFSLWLRPDF